MGRSINLRFNASLLAGDGLKLQWGAEQYNRSQWGIADSSTMMVCIGRAGMETLPADCLTDATLWAPAPLSQSSASPDSLVVDLQNLQVGPGGALAVRYAWPLADGADTCCPSKLVRDGHMPCVPGSCPILTTKSSLPANPFYATLESGKCNCMPPQKCDGSEL